jgi:hypothetical protein
VRNLWPRTCHDCGVPFNGMNDAHMRCDPCRVRTNKARAVAQSKVRYAVLTGRLPSLRKNAAPCVDCGCRASCYDHRDYRKPLDVVPVCDTCNRKRGPAAPLGAAVIAALDARKAAE